MNGQCLCGAVRIEMEPARQKLTVCHCDMCRRWCSGPFFSIQGKAGATIDGPAKAVKTSEWAERGHCGACGSNLWYRMTDPEGPINFAAGLFETGEIPVGLEVWVDEKPDGFALMGDQKRMTGAQVLAAMGIAEDGVKDE